MAMAQGGSTDLQAATSSNDAAMNARMDQLQNQINQMILMMQNNKKTNGIPFMGSEGKPKPIASFISRSYKLIASHVSAKKYRVIASILISQRYLWVVDSGVETDIREKDEKSSKNGQNQARNGKAWKSQSQIKAKVQERQSQRSKPEPTPKNT
ncbi:hypothetical protein Tco_0541476 [Tanacetum coccineum]